MKRTLTLLATAALVVVGCSNSDRNSEAEPEPPAAGVVEVTPVAPGQPAAVTHGNDPLPPKPATLVAEAVPEAPWPCEGTGTDGRRVQMLYAHGGNGNLASLRPTFEGITRRIEGSFLTSAAKQGGERLVRVVTDPNCALSIVDVPVSAEALSSFDRMISELAAKGFNQINRIYHVWAEANAYCGIGTVYTDDRASGNYNEQFAQYSRSDRNCWNYAEAHEIVHNLGGVQNSAPNSTGGLHSRDEHDVMSYADGAPKGQMIQPFPCPDVAQETRLDCGNNDYFAVAPAPGSYLATRWNVANASALSRAAGTTTSTTVPPTTSTSTSTTVPPTTSTSIGQGETRIELTAPSRFTRDEPFTVTALVSGDCRPTGTVAFYLSGRLMSRQILAPHNETTGRAEIVLTVTSAVGRPTIRADYLGDANCEGSRDTARPRAS